MSKHNKAIVGVAMLLRRGDKILLSRRQNTGYYDGWWSLPSGHVETGESPVQALMRETAEELAIAIDQKDIRFVHAIYAIKHDATDNRVGLYFEVKKWDGLPINAEPYKCADICWFPINALPENTIHHMKNVVLSIEKNILYSEYDLEYFIRNQADISSPVVE